MYASEPTHDLTAGTTAVRIYLLSCGHLVWAAQPVYGEPNHCLSCNRGATVEHYIDEQVTDADPGTFHLMAVQDWGGSQENWDDWISHLTRAAAEAIARDMIAADQLIHEDASPEAYEQAEATYGAKYGTDWNRLVSGNVAPGWSAIFIVPCPAGCAGPIVPGRLWGDVGTPWWKSGQPIP